MQPAVELVRCPSSACDGGGELCVGEPVVGADVRDASGRDRADGVLGLQRVPDLADGESVERGAEGAGDLARDLHAAAREADDDRRLALHLREGAGKLPPGLEAVRETRRAEHRLSSTVSMTAAAAGASGRPRSRRSANYAASGGSPSAGSGRMRSP